MRHALLAAIIHRRRKLLLGAASPEFNAFWHADFWVDGFWVDNFWVES